MSVIYKALSTIDASEGVRHVYPGGTDPAAARGGAGGRGGKVLLTGVVLLGLGGAAAIVAEPGWLLSRTVVSAGTSPPPTLRPDTRPPMASQTADVAPDSPAVDDRVLSNRVPGRAAVDPEPSVQAAFVFEPAKAGHASNGPAASQAPETSEASEAAGKPRTPRGAQDGASAAAQVAAAPAVGGTVARAPASRTVSGPPVSVEHDAGREPAAVNTGHTRRVRLLNADLQRALKTRNTDEVARMLDEMEALVGADSSYMLKMRAFTQLTLGGDTEHAMSLLREVLVREPGDEDAALNMAVAEIGMGELAEARARLEALAIVHPGDDRISKMLRSIQ